MVQYSFKSGNEHPLPLMPHGNSKKKKAAYVRTWASTREQLERVAGEMKPREAVHYAIAEGLGGLQTCSGIGQVPRNRQQVADMARRKDASKGPCRKNMSGAGRSSDPWYMLLNESKIHGRDVKTAFVRDVRVGTEPFCVVATNRQLNDLKRFCCTPVEYRPFTVDPTFDLGPYNVTPISYEHLLLVRRKDGNHPTPELKNLMAFGTDDEKALAGGFNENFERATHLLCEIHLRKNIEGKLVSMDIKGEDKRSIMDDIFGRKVGNVFESGLSDAEGQAKFIGLLGSLEDKWTAAHANGKAFHSWFSEKKSEDFIRSVIRPVRQRAGLGCPPAKFTTNRSERTNGVLQDFVKRNCGSAKVDEYTFVKSLEKLVETQEQEIELAVLDKGEYQLRNEFAHIVISGEEWAKMTNEQRKAALSRIHEINLDNVVPNNVAAINAKLTEDASPVFKQIISAGVDWITSDVLKLVAKKSENILKQGKVTELPAANAHDTVVIPSTSNPTKPHIIVLYANGKVECQDCPGYAASSICAHAVAASMTKGNLDVYLKWLVANNRKSGGINYSKAITYGMPAGRGRKGGRPPRSRRGKQTTSAVIPRIATPRAAIQMTPMVPPNDHGLESPMSLPAVPSQFPVTSGPSTAGVQLNRSQPGYHTTNSNPSAAVQMTPMVPLNDQVLASSMSGWPAIPSLFPVLTDPSTAGEQLHRPQPGYHTTYSNSSAAVQMTPLVPPNDHGLASPMSLPAVSSLFPVPSTGKQLHLSQPGYHPKYSNPALAAAGAWHSGLSPHLYHLVALPSNVKKCYGCGNCFADRFRQSPYNVVVKHIDRRVMRRDQATGALVYSPDYTNTYYHPSFAHIQRKNPMFDGQVFIESAVYRALGVNQIEVLKQYDLNINICN